MTPSCQATTWLLNDQASALLHTQKRNGQLGQFSLHNGKMNLHDVMNCFALFLSAHLVEKIRP
jgi:hypothetical protein